MTDTLPTKEEWEEIREYTSAEGWSLDCLFAIIDAYGSAVRELPSDDCLQPPCLSTLAKLRLLAERYGRKV
jgi:hypothetical protein